MCTPAPLSIAARRNSIFVPVHGGSEPYKTKGERKLFINSIAVIAIQGAPGCRPLSRVRQRPGGRASGKGPVGGLVTFYHTNLLSPFRHHSQAGYFIRTVQRNRDRIRKRKPIERRWASRAFVESKREENGALRGRQQEHLQPYKQREGPIEGGTQTSALRDVPLTTSWTF